MHGSRPLDLVLLGRPSGVAAATLVLMALVALQQYSARLDSPALLDLEQAHRKALGGQPNVFLYLGWIILLLALVAVLGFPLGSMVFMIAFIWAE